MIKLKSVLKMLENWLGISGTPEIFYIGGSDVLPPPLSPEEEKKMLEEFDKGSQEARAVLIERNLRLVVYIAKKFDNSGINVEDRPFEHPLHLRGSAPQQCGHPHFPAAFRRIPAPAYCRGLAEECRPA